MSEFLLGFINEPRSFLVTGWMTLQSAAARHNASLSPQYLTLLIKTEGVSLYSLAPIWFRTGG